MQPRLSKCRPTVICGSTGMALLLLVLAASVVPAQAEVRWRTDSPAGLQGAPADLSAALAELSQNAAGRHIVVQFKQPVTPDQRATLQGAGLTLLSYVGDNAFFAAVTSDGLDLDTLREFPALVDAREIEREWKLDPRIVANAYPAYAIGIDPDTKQTLVAANLLFHRDVNLSVEGLNVVGRHGATVVAEIGSLNGVVIELPQANVNALADEDAVQWIEPPLPFMTPTNNSNRVITQADQAQSSPYNLDGSGINVLVYDGGYALQSHGDFGGRLTVRDSSGLSNHSTHVAGTIGGDGSGSGGTYRGMAPGVTLQSYGFQYDGSGIFLYSNPGDIEQDYNQAINTYGVDIANNSIGTNTETNGFDCAIQGNYGVTSALIDAIVGGSLGAPFRIVWANGNERQGSRCDVEGYGDYYSTAPPAGAKNHITVGALNSNNDSMTSFSSWGPVDDGRLKPDISAPGCQSNDDYGVTSTSSSGGYTTMCGTSMASPTVCGLLALVLEDYRAQFPSQPDPRNSTLKVLLAHNAVDLGNTGPDYQFGYGSVRVRDTIDFMRTGNFTEDQVAQGGTVSYQIDVPGGTSELKLTLAWDDVPGTPNVDPALVNDLDLFVLSPSSQQAYPWTLDPYNPSAAATRNQADHRNNIEQVYVASPAAGTWTIEVRGYNVPDGPQSFSLCVTPGLSQSGLFISLPNGAPTEIPPSTPTPIEVQITAFDEDYVAGSGTFYYRFDGGTYQTAALTPLGGDLFQATLPAAACDDMPEYYFSAAGTVSGTVYLPADAPASVYAAIVGETTTVLDDNFETDQGWTAENLGATSGDWQRGVPVDDDSWAYDPASDSDGSGQCYLTQNELGNTDVDNGAVRLTSPVFDLSGGNATISYDYFLRLTNTTGGVDMLLVEISSNGASGPWTEIARHDTDGGLSWRSHTITQGDLDAAGVTLTTNMQLRFTTNDADTQSINESGLDAVLITAFTCEGGGTCDDGILNQGEDRIDCGGPCPPCECLSDGECDDGAFCNGAETCDEYGDCQSGSDPCPGQYCDEVSDACVECLEDGHCDDGVFCNGAETCVDGSCVAGSDPCPGQMCDEDNDICVDCLGDGDCDDGLYCNGSETCVGGSCLPSTSIDCDDGIDCTVDSCNEATDSCDNIPDDGFCDDGLFCNGAETCDDQLGCVAGSDPCPGQYCDEVSDACVECLGDGDCDDGVFCNGAETCVDGSCVAGSDPCPGQMCDEDNDICVECLGDGDCDDGLYCNGAEICVGGSCLPGTAVDCDDGVDCTVDSCNEDTDSCDNLPDDGFCDDGLFCDGVETCDDQLGCVPGSDPCPGQYCDEVNDVCVECLGDGDCDDGLFCNGAETCVDGSCVAGSDPCPGQACDEDNDVCVDCLGDGDCDDGLYCNGAETCVGGSCLPGTAVDCDDGVDCTVDSCNEDTDSCDNIPDDGFCDDGLFCNGAETCDDQLGCVPGSDPCPGQYCDEMSDACVECLGDGDCDDGLFCNGVETCVDGSCQPGDDPCPGQGCDEENDQCIPEPTAQLESGTVTVGGSPVTVGLANSYFSPVVVCSVQYANNTTPVVARVGNVTSTSFDVRLQSPSGSAVAAETVSYLVVEEGVWTIDGVNIEAQTYLSTVTDENNSWVGEAQSYGQSYSNPVVLGQVMSETDADWSVFWCQGDSRTNPPSPTALRTGKTVCEDTDVTRADETVGFIVLEAGHGTLGGVEFEALLGADKIQGTGNAPPYTYTFNTAFAAAPQVAVNTMAAVDGNNGGWSQTHGSTMATSTTLYLSIEEDLIGDTERSHTTEQVGYIVFEMPVVYPSGPQCYGDEDCDDGLFCDGAETCVDGSCVAGSDPCPGQMCDEDNDICVECLGDGDCDDGLYCNGAEACVGGSCQPGTAVNCDDAIDCTIDSCNENTDSCDSIPDDGFCDDGLFCNGAETCDDQLGCVAGGDPCPGQYCDEDNDTCLECLGDGDCDDGLFCNGAETCVDGSCEPGVDPCPGQGCDEENDQCISEPTAQLETGSAVVGGSYVTVYLANSYFSPVVVCSLQYANSTTPVVVRISNVTSTSFDVRLQNPSDGAVATENVFYLVVEEGVWTIDGVNIEAQTYLSTVTDENNSWVGQAQSYRQSYVSPVVLGQVMSENDPDWSSFWCCGSGRQNPPSASALVTGKMVGEDSDVTRADEIVGFIVIEQGSGTIGGVEFEALLGADIVRGIDNSPPYAYSFDAPFATAPQIAVVTMAAMDGGDGGWAYAYGSTSTAPTTLYVSVDEDQTNDSERKHATEQVGYVVFESAIVYP